MFWFFLLFLILLFSLHMLFYLRVIRKLSFGKRVTQLFSIFIAANFVFNLLYVVMRYSDILGGVLLYAASISMGISFVLFLYLLLHEVLHVLHRPLKKLHRSRREFLKKSTDTSLLALASSYIGVGLYEGSKKPIVNTVKTSLFDFSIVQISDLHIGGLIDMEYVQKSVEKINALHPDIVTITGDLVDTDIDTISTIVLELNNIQARYGIYMVLGNHEYFHNPYKIINFIQKQTKIQLLLNDAITIETLHVNIVGVNDLFGYRIDLLQPDFNKAFSRAKKQYPTLLLSHQPKSIEYLGNFTPRLILSGHTHGGQIWPFNYLVMLQQPYLKGLHKLQNGSYIYVNSGIGFWGPPMRLASQAEIAYII